MIDVILTISLKQKLAYSFPAKPTLLKQPKASPNTDTKFR